MSRTRSFLVRANSCLFAWGLCGWALVGCGPTVGPVEPVQAVQTRAEQPEPGDRCLPFAGPPSDVDLRGLARTHPARCCPSGYGLDPALAQRSCGFTEYLGESEELACVHRFRTADGQIEELRLSPIVDLPFDDAVALQERGEFGPDHVGQALAELPGIWTSSEAGRNWALLPGWSTVRRIAWNEAACSTTSMLPVLAGMLEAPDDPAAAQVLPRLVDEPSSASPPSPSLLDLEFDPPTPGRSYPLPRAAPQLVHDLLGAAASDDLGRFVELLEPTARIGLPDRRELGANAILGDPAAAQRRLLAAAARLPATTSLRCPTIDRRVKPEVARGETPMWCFWISDDSLDLLVVGLRGRVVAEQVDARVTYLGVFPVRPAAPVVLVGEPPPPPVVPTPQLVCGDPHASAYPGACPDSSADEAEDEGGDEDE